MPLGTIRLQDVRRLLRTAADLELCGADVQKLKWFQYALEHEGNISLTCRHFGISRSTFLRWANRFDATDIRSLEEESRKPHTVRTPETDAATVALIRTIREAHPRLGKEPVAAMLKEQYGVTVSTATVGRVITRHKLFFADTEAHRSKRNVDAETETEHDVPVVTTKTTAESDEWNDPLLFPSPGVTS